MFWRSKKPASGTPPTTPPANPALPAALEGAAGSTARFLTGDREADRRTVEVLLEMFARLSETRDYDETLVQIVDNSVELCGAERGFLVVLDEAGEFVIKVARTRDRRPVQDSSVSRPPWCATCSSTRAQARHRPERPGPATSASRCSTALRAVMWAASRQGRALSAGRYTSTRAPRRGVQPARLELFYAHSQQAAITLEAPHAPRVAQEGAPRAIARLAMAVQSGLMPRIPRTSG
jgi:hypothetical protein